MTDTSSENNRLFEETREYITNIALGRIQILEDASDAIDQKGGIVLGFIAVVIALVLGGSAPDLSSPLDMLFGYVGFGALFAALFVLAACLAPKTRRLDPDVEKLLRDCWDSPLDSTRQNVAANLRSAWQVNSRAHRKKTTLFNMALWLTVTGIAALAFDVLVVRAVM